jgi:hypothetical protein
MMVAVMKRSLTRLDGLRGLRRGGVDDGSGDRDHSLALTACERREVRALMMVAVMKRTLTCLDGLRGLRRGGVDNGGCDEEITHLP